ncbi:MAG: 2-dehydropantoate 2-reductase [Pseudomonadota bacterium]
MTTAPRHLPLAGARERRLPVLVHGAGSVGLWVGGHLAAAGWAVSFVGRAERLRPLAALGLTLTDLEGARRHVAPAALTLAEQLDELDLARRPPALTLLCVKGGATAAAAAELAQALPPGSLVLSLQNGVGNAELAREHAPGLTWLAGMVACNIAELVPGQLHRGTAGALAAQQHAALLPWVDWFAAAGLPLALHDDMPAVLWAKLMLNLNNPVNALSGLPLRAELLDRGFRHCYAALVDEALGLMSLAGIVPARITPLPMARLPALLRLPTPLFRLVAARLLRIDPHARSSMADDLARRRPTEVDLLAGEVVRLAHRLGRTAPLNARICELVDRQPRPGQPRSSQELIRELGL